MEAGSCQKTYRRKRREASRYLGKLRRPPSLYAALFRRVLAPL